ncbi:MAG: hypothetical protein WCJ09_09890 [Planctomycetota bacterium]
MKVPVDAVWRGLSAAAIFPISIGLIPLLLFSVVSGTIQILGSIFQGELPGNHATLLLLVCVAGLIGLVALWTTIVIPNSDICVSPRICGFVLLGLPLGIAAEVLFFSSLVQSGKFELGWQIAAGFTLFAGVLPVGLVNFSRLGYTAMRT